MKDFKGDIHSVGDFFYLLKASFPNVEKGIDGVTTAFKNGARGTDLFKAGLQGIGTVISAHPLLTLAAGIGVVIGVIKLADHLLDKSNDSTDELLKKKDNITKNLSEVNSELENIDNQIAELNKQKLNITDSNDISALNSQIELLQQRKELLEWKAQNDRKENENNANDIIESAKNNSTYSGASCIKTKTMKLNMSKETYVII